MSLWHIPPSDAAILESNPATVVGVAFRRMMVATTVSMGVFVALVMWRGTFPPLVIVLALAMSIVGAPWLFMRKMSQSAHKRRSDMNMAVAMFLDLVNVLLAGGAGIETALLTAASAGDGWSFDYIRGALAKAQSSRANYWDALDRAGVDIDVQSLQDMAQSMRIAGEQGGRIRQSLSSRADALRKNNLASIEHEAQRRTERLGIPMVMMFVGFVMFIGYPAFVSTMTSL